MKISTEFKEGFAIVSLRGPLDVETVAEIKQDLTDLTERETKGVVLDMGGVTFMDSSGVGALVFMYKRLIAQQRLLHLVGLVNQPLKLVKLLRINQTIPVHSQITDISSLPHIAAVQEG